MPTLARKWLPPVAIDRQSEAECVRARVFPSSRAHPFARLPPGKPCKLTFPSSFDGGRFLRNGLLRMTSPPFSERLRNVLRKKLGLYEPAAAAVAAVPAAPVFHGRAKHCSVFVI